MTYLLLNRRPILGAVVQWFAARAQELIIVTERAAAEDTDLESLQSHVQSLFVLDDYTSGDTFELASSLCAAFEPARIVTTAEADVLRAAELRERYNIPGQQLDSATAYRDKYVMKGILAAQGLPVAPMKALGSKSDLWGFIDNVGYPIVLKRRRGAGSSGMAVVNSAGEVEHVLGVRGLTTDLLAEAWVEGHPYQVNGFMRNGTVLQGWPTRALYSDWAMIADHRPGLTGMLPADHPLFDRLQRLTVQVVGALPPTPDITPFHAEFFHTSGNDVVVCEIACRAGGGRIVEMYEAAYGLNMYEMAVRGQLGDTLEIAADSPSRRYGFASFPPRPGILRDLPADCDVPGVERYWCTGVVGQTYEGARSMGTTIAQLLFELRRPDIDAELAEIGRWWDRHEVWLPA